MLESNTTAIDTMFKYLYKLSFIHYIGMKKKLDRGKKQTNVELPRPRESGHKGPVRAPQICVHSSTFNYTICMKLVTREQLSLKR